MSAPYRSGEHLVRRVPRHLHRAARFAAVSVLAIATIAYCASGVPGFFGLATVRVMGASMGESVPIGSLAVVRPTDATKVREGMVIVFGEHGRIPTLHRVTRLRHNDGATYATTAGDANATRDATEHRMEGIGSVHVATIPYLGYVLTVLRDRSLGIFVLAVAFVSSGRSRRRGSSLVRNNTETGKQ